MLERDLNRKVSALFKKMAPDLLAIKKDQGKHSMRAGIFDWILCYKGKAIFIELKVNNNRMTPLQLLFQREARAAGGIAEEARSINDVKKILERVDELRIDGSSKKSP